MNDAQNLNNDWRKTAVAIYRKPVDSKIVGSVELDVTDLEKYVSAQRQKGIKITITHVLLLAVARAFREETPEFNTYVRRGRIVQREHIDATLSVLIQGETQMGSVKIPDADRMTLAELAEFITREVPKSRKGDENKTMGMKSKIAAIPWPFRRWFLDLVKYLTVNWSLSIPSLGVSANSFGSFVFSNIGAVGLDMGYPALMPLANISIVLIMGSVNTKPAVVDGQIVPRRILNLGAALDHRTVDAVHGGRLFKYIKNVVRHPEVLEEKPGWV